MRGVIPARFLQEIEEVIPGIQWDLIAGTSTGSIVGAMKSAPQPKTAADILKWYYEDGPSIFHESIFHKPTDILNAKYGTVSLYKSLQACIGTHSMAECSTPFVCATTDADHILPIWLDQSSVGWNAWEAAAASSSAQTYFPAFRKDGVRYIDGGNFANNPVRHAANLARKLWPAEKIIAVSLGTGIEINPKALPEGGPIQWATRVFDEMSNLQRLEANRDAQYAADQVFFLDVQAQRFPSMDVCDKATLDGYVWATNGEIVRNPALWNQIKEALK